MAVTINGTLREIIVDDPGTFSIDVESELYSEWKRWSQLADNSKYAPAFRTFGGDGTAIGQTAPKYFFLINFWRVRITNGNVVAVGLNLYTDDYPTPYIVDPGSGVSDRNSDAVSVNSVAIEYGAFQNGVTIDVVNGVSGTGYPVGTPLSPVNNYADALAIAQFRGFDTFYVRGSLTLDTGDNAEGYRFVGNGTAKSTLIVNPGASVQDIEMELLNVAGDFDGTAIFRNCLLGNISSVQGEFIDSTLLGTITLVGGGETLLINCNDGSTVTGDVPTIDFNNSGHYFGVRKYSGDLELINKTGTGEVEVNIATGGELILDSTVTNGNIRVTGTFNLTDNSTGAVVVDESSNLLNLLEQILAAGGSLTPEQNQRLIDIHKSMALDADHEVTHTPSGFVVDDITVDFDGDGENITIAQRQP